MEVGGGLTVSASGGQLAVGRGISGRRGVTTVCLGRKHGPCRGMDALGGRSERDEKGQGADQSWFSRFSFIWVFLFFGMKIVGHVREPWG